MAAQDNSLQQLMLEQKWDAAARQIAGADNLAARPDLQHLLGVCYINCPDFRLDAGVKYLVAALESGRLPDSYCRNYALALQNLLKHEEYGAALKLVQAMVNNPQTCSEKVRVEYVELLIRCGKYQSALELCAGLSSRFNRSYYAAYCHYFLGLRDRASETLREALKAEPLKSGQPARGDSGRILFLLAPGSLQFIPRLEKRLSFSFHGGHFDTTIILQNLSLSQQIDYLFYNESMLQETEYWSGILDSYDVIINAVADAETLSHSLSGIVSLCKVLETGKLINPPERVLSSGRVSVYEACKNLDGIIFPRTDTLLEGDSIDLDFPVLARPPGSSTGIGLEKCDSEAALVERLQKSAGPLICTEFVETGDNRGHYTKYRVFFIDGELLPEHRVVCSSWNVHSSSRLELMLTDQVLRNRERDFVNDLRSSLSDKHVMALRKLGTTLGLDYMGVDFTPVDSERLLVFEANAGMRINASYVDDFTYLAAPIQKIIRAFGNLLGRRLAGQRAE